MQGEISQKFPNWEICAFFRPIKMRKPNADKQQAILQNFPKISQCETSQTFAKLKIFRKAIKNCSFF